MRISNVLLLVTALGLLLCLRPANAAAPKDNCTGFISSVPTVISTPGTWCLSQNLATSIASGDAITVATDDVVIDGNDFAIDGTGAGLATTAIGIHAINRNRTIVRHFRVRGFYRGIFIDGSGSRDVIEDNLVDQSTHNGIDLLATDSVIRHNLVTRTGGTTTTPTASAFGIIASSLSNDGLNDVLDNTVEGVAATAGTNKSAYGLSVNASLDGPVVRGNRVSGLMNSGGATIALLAGPNARGSIRDNDFVNGVNGSVLIGMNCTGNSGESLPGIRAKKNVISGFQYSDLTTCGDAGRNDFYVP